LLDIDLVAVELKKSAKDFGRGILVDSEEIHLNEFVLFVKV
jgi:hypothetical protein